MPVCFQKSSNNYRLAIWKIEEPESFFIPKLTLSEFDRSEIEKINADNKLLQWYASRYLLKLLIDPEQFILLSKDEYGKPIVENSNLKISISHCRNYAAAIISHKGECGIDIETFDKRIVRISEKFLYESEIKEILDKKKYVEILTLYWSAKEALYKYYGKKSLTFMTQLIIQKFELENEGMLNGFIRTEHKIENLKVQYKNLEELMLTFVLSET